MRKKNGKVERFVDLARYLGFIRFCCVEVNDCFHCIKCMAGVASWIDREVGDEWIDGWMIRNQESGQTRAKQMNGKIEDGI